MKYRDPVTDRTLADAKSRTAKGLFNISDWVRIYDNERIANMIQTLFNGRGAVLHELTTPTVSTIPTAGDINQLVDNIELIRAVVCFTVTGLDPLNTNWRGGLNALAPDYADVNAWEAKLDILRSAVVRAGDYRMFTGVPACGQARYYQYHWRTLSYVPDAASPVRRARSGAGDCGAGLTRQNLFRRY